MHDCGHIMKNGKCACGLQHKYLAVIYSKEKGKHQNKTYDLTHLHPCQDVLHLNVSTLKFIILL